MSSFLFTLSSFSSDTALKISRKHVRKRYREHYIIVETNCRLYVTVKMLPFYRMHYEIHVTQYVVNKLDYQNQLKIAYFRYFTSNTFLKVIKSQAYIYLQKYFNFITLINYLNTLRVEFCFTKLQDHIYLKFIFKCHNWF